MEALGWLLGGAIGVLAIPSMTSLFVEGAWRSRWRLEDTREDDLSVEGQGVFREATVRATVAAVKRDRAPGWLRAMAFSCWFLGQMVIPGFLAWCVGLLMLDKLQTDPAAMVLMASFFPGVVCAGLLWRAGASLVRGERDRADRATRHAATVIVGYNALILVGAGAWLSTHHRDEFLIGCMGYAVVSIVHAIAVRGAFLAHRDQFPIEHAQP